MSDERMVFCKKLQKELPGLSRPPFKNELGAKIYNEISKEAWAQWIKDSVKYINTYRIDTTSKQGQDFLMKQIGIYFGFEDGELAATAFTPADHK